MTDQKESELQNLNVLNTQIRLKKTLEEADHLLGKRASDLSSELGNREGHAALVEEVNSTLSDYAKRVFQVTQTQERFGNYGLMSGFEGDTVVLDQMGRYQMETSEDRTFFGELWNSNDKKCLSIDEDVQAHPIEAMWRDGLQNGIQGTYCEALLKEQTPNQQGLLQALANLYSGNSQAQDIARIAHFAHDALLALRFLSREDVSEYGERLGARVADHLIRGTDWKQETK